MWWCGIDDETGEVWLVVGADEESARQALAAAKGSDGDEFRVARVEEPVGAVNLTTLLNKG